MAIAGAVGAAQGAAAYAAASRPAATTEAGGFGGALARALEGGISVGRSADASATQALMGQGGVTEAVLAISRAELALQTAVSLRDRMVAAYQDVMRMPI